MNKLFLMAIAAAIILVPSGQYIYAYDGTVPDDSMSCPEGHECFCIPGSGVYVDKTAGSRVSSGCTGAGGTG